jgi:SAM-dependent methyltransferase
MTAAWIHQTARAAMKTVRAGRAATSRLAPRTNRGSCSRAATAGRLASIQVVLRAEAAWLTRELDRLAVADLSPLLSIGSGHGELASDQPWLYRSVYEPLERRGVRLVHHELDPAPGVDVAGDLMDPAFRESLGRLELRSVMCCNVLEYLPEPRRVAETIEELVAPGGYAIVTVPRRYPYHPGPIDTMFRPSVDELRTLMPELSEVTAAQEIRTESLVAYLLASPNKRTAIARGLRSSAHRGNGVAVPLRETARMLVGSTAVSAVILRRR